MTTNDRPPLICPNCVEHQTHHPLDQKREQFYCPHERVWAIRQKDRPGWIIQTDIGQVQHRKMMNMAASLAQMQATLQGDES